MTTLLSGLLIGWMGEYEFARDLLAWAQAWVGSVKNHPSTVDYPRLEPALLDAIKKVAGDLGSVPLLKFAVQLEAMDKRIEAMNPKDDGSVFDTYFGLKDEIPDLERGLKKKLLLYAAIWCVCFVVLWALTLLVLMCLLRSITIT